MRRLIQQSRETELLLCGTRIHHQVEVHVDHSSRYLTKVADQIICLVSPAQARSFVWQDDLDNSIVIIDEEQSDRLYTFEVSTTNEQEENVSVREGFKARNPDSPRFQPKLML